MRVSSPAGLAAGFAFSAALLPLPAPALALPDLVPEVTNLTVKTADVTAADFDEGCAGGQFGRRLVSFSLRTHNLGPDDLVLGNPGCPNCSLNPGATCTNPLFVCGTSHGHAHFESFAKNEILDEFDNVVAEGDKYGFCLLDQGSCPTPQYSCSYQGITAGCSDVYSAGLPCQYIDITDDALPDGLYRLRVTIDPDNQFPEANESNNTLEVPFEIGATPRTCPDYASTDVPRAIPDLTAVSSVVSVTASGPIDSVRVRLNGTHTYLGDLDATLTSPGSTTRTLFSQICGTDDDFDLYLGDDGVGPLICPATDGSVLRQAAESFAPFAGEEAGGDWTLEITDIATANTGTLDDWTLEVCTVCGNATLDAGEACDDGNNDDGDCCSSDCQTPAADSTPCEDGNLCTTAETCSAGTCVPGGATPCDPCLVCEPEAGCVVPDLIYPCQEPPARGSLLRARRDAVDPGRDLVRWKWRSETPVELDEFGAPDLLTDISVCVYDAGSLVLSATIPAASDCGGRPCWVRREHNAAFKDKAGTFGGLTSIRIREGTKGKISVKARGDGLGLPPLSLAVPATVRMRRNDDTPCWEANYDEAAAATDDIFRARSR